MDARGCLIVCFMLVGCSASQRIAERATEIREYADEIVVATDRIDYNGEEVRQIRSNAVAIRDAVDDIHTALPNVTDRTPWWADMIRWLAIAAAGAAAVWLLTASGILGAVRAALGWIPRRKFTEAQMMAATLAQDKPETVRELVAMLRAQDPLLDKAMRQVKQENSQP
jgi:hypothetical protein